MGLSTYDVIDCAGRYFLPPPVSPLPLSSCFSALLHLCHHCEKAREWQEGGEPENKGEGYDRQPIEDFPKHFSSILSFMTAGTSYVTRNYGITVVCSKGRKKVKTNHLNSPKRLRTSCYATVMTNCECLFKDTAIVLVIFFQESQDYSNNVM